jgi:hypothetical protein
LVYRKQAALGEIKLKTCARPIYWATLEAPVTIAQGCGRGPSSPLDITALEIDGNTRHHLLQGISHNNRHKEIPTGVNLGRELP